MTFAFHAKHHFQPPSPDDHIATVPFLDASNEILVIIDYLGPSFLKSAFQRTRSDVAGNISRIRAKYESSPVQFRSLNCILDEERIAGCSDATVALLWLKRTLEFVFHLCLLLLKETEEHGADDSDPYLQEPTETDQDYVYMSTIVLKAYDASLKRFHNYFLQGLFYLVAHVMPSKEGFIRLLAGGCETKEDEAKEELRKLVEGIERNLKIINKIFIDMGRNEEY